MAAYIELWIPLEADGCSAGLLRLQARKQSQALGSWKGEKQEGRLLIPPPFMLPS